jgi:GDP-4-dehydro-6-deoxy-D-mannose reductase
MKTDLSDPAKTRLLVTGANGFVAPYIIKELDGYGIASSQIFRTSLHGDDTGVIGIDLRDRDAVNHLISDLRPTKILHLAAQSSLVKSDASAVEAWRSNFEATRNIAEAVVRLSPGSLFIFSSTAQVYGGSFRGRLAVTEATPIDPRGVYARTKAAAEFMLEDVLKGAANLIVLRLFNHTGPGQTRDFVVPEFAAQIAEIERGNREGVLRVGNLDVRRDFLDVRDVARAYVSILVDAHQPSGFALYNVGSGQARSIRGMLETLISQAKVPIQIETDPSRLRASDITRTSGSIRAFNARYSWVPKISIRRTLLNTLEYWRSR